MHGKLRGSKASLVFCLQKFPDPSKNSAWAASNQLSSLLPVQYVYIGLLQQDHLTGPDNSSFIILGSWFVRTVYRNVVEYQNKWAHTCSGLEEVQNVLGDLFLMRWDSKTTRPQSRRVPCRQISGEVAKYSTTTEVAKYSTTTVLDYFY